MASTQQYRLTDPQGKNAAIKSSIAGQVIKLMQTGHSVITPEQLNYELGIANGSDILAELERGNYVEKVSEKKGWL